MSLVLAAGFAFALGVCPRHSVQAGVWSRVSRNEMHEHRNEISCCIQCMVYFLLCMTMLHCVQLLSASKSVADNPC